MKELKCPNKQGGWIALNAILGVPKSTASGPPTENLLAWYQFNTGITEETGVSNWADQSGNGNDMAQATTTKQPSNASGIITFDGTDDWMETSNFARGIPNTLYMRMKINAVAVDYFSTAAQSDRYIFYRTATSGQHRINNGSEVAMTGGYEDTWMSVACVFNGASSVLEEYGKTPVTGDTGSTTTNDGGLTIAGNSGGAATAAISIKEVLLYGAAHDQDTRTAILEYLEGI